MIKILNKSIHTILTLFFPFFVFAQVVTVTPAFPTENDEVTIIFDATQGTGGLEDCNCDVYLHTGVITSASTSNSDWKHVVTSWGSANSAWKLDKVAGEANLYSYVISPTIKDYYGIAVDETVEKLAFVFRNGSGSLEGKDEGGNDIFVDIYPDDGEFSIALNSPSQKDILVELSDQIPVKVSTSDIATITIYEDGISLYSELGEAVEFIIDVSDKGTHFVEIVADNGSETKSVSFNYTVPLNTKFENLPANIEDGINVINDSTVVFSLFAPGKDHVFIIGDFNEWKINTNHQLNKTPDGNNWWMELSYLDPEQQYGFQYLVDGEIKIGDPYSEIVLDPWNDKYIAEETFPNLKEYPENKTSGIVSVFSTKQDDFIWEYDDYERPKNEKLIIYELMLRDFLKDHSFKSLTDTLDYLDRLGVNAIELMPVNEFEGNQSWGYNPSYHYALDKYYGSPEAFKTLVDEAHKRGMAIIIDVVYNHGFSLCPLAKLYWDDAQFRPSAESPWFNQEPKHPFNVGYDFNHLSEATKYYVKRGLEHYLEDFHVDGFRFDLSKGFTQKLSYNNDQMAAYDGSRIGILKDYADFIWSVDDSAYVILEHFATNSEEKELANYGMMLWGNMNHEYNEACMGYTSNLSYVTHKERGWSKPHLIGYMESHDEERLMYKNLKYGKTNGDYSVKTLSIASDRMELNSAFFFTLPGPKMMWQFGELGYDFSINRCEDGSISDNCRLSPKPIRWDYKYINDRSDIYSVWSKLTNLKQEYDIFNTTDFTYSLNTYLKSINLNSDEMNVTIIGNFDVKSGSINPKFQHSGWWFDYFSGDSIMVVNTTETITLNAGEYHLYSDKKLKGHGITGISDLTINNDLIIFPNPANSIINLIINSSNHQNIKIDILDVSGNLISNFTTNVRQGDNQIEIPLNQLPEGMYFVKVLSVDFYSMRKIVVLK